MLVCHSVTYLKKPKNDRQQKIATKEAYSQCDITPCPCCASDRSQCRLQNRSDWSNQSCELQGHDMKYHNNGPILVKSQKPFACI